MKFICNGMLGKLCRLLRTCGIDTAYSNEGMAILLLARKEQRVILTRNTQLKDKQNVLFLELCEPREQLRNVIEHYKLHTDIHLFSRCIECNAELKHVRKTSVKGKVPYFTYKNFQEFAQCPQCGRVYWKGSHYKNMLREIKDVLGSRLQNE